MNEQELKHHIRTRITQLPFEDYDEFIATAARYQRLSNFDATLSTPAVVQWNTATQHSALSELVNMIYRLVTT